ncbi:TolC family protein [Rhizorhabdus dicambivorans]|uniref:TolC family protein n=1 Tax=Rhizorhabdus dicambivorans TaxID=1850238 RepID=UPI002F26455F
MAIGRLVAQFGDPQLDRLIAEGLASATDLRVAEARFAKADALVRQTRSRLLPSLSADAQAGATKQSYNYLIPGDFSPRGWPDYGQGALSLDWDLDFWARTAPRSPRPARRPSGCRRGGRRASRRVGGDRRSLCRSRRSLRRAGRRGRRGAGARRTLELIAGRKSQGLENDGAVERARSALASAQSELAALAESLALTRNRIAVLLGAGPDRGLSVERPAPAASSVFGLPANLPAELIGRRPDIIAARLRAEARQAGSSKPAPLLPERQSRRPDRPAGARRRQCVQIRFNLGTVGPAISLPIFDGGRLRGQYRAAEADYAIAVAQYDGTLAQALREVADAAASERALGERLDRAQEAERAASAACTVANNRYRGGLATYLDVLVAEDALIAARRAVASLQTRAFALDVALIRALGGGFRS